MRRHLLFKSVAFLVAVFLVDRLSYRVLKAGWSRIETGVRGGMINAARRSGAEIMIMGSSRAWRHFDAPFLRERLGRSVYNAGCDGQGVPYMRGLTDLILQNYRPRLLVLNIDPTNIATGGNHLDRVVQMSPFMDESRVIREIIYHRGVLEPLKYSMLTVRYNSKPLVILRNLARSAPDNPSCGFLPLDKEMNPVAAAQNPERECSDEPFEVDPYLVKLLCETIEAAQAAGVTPVIVTSPYWRPDGRVSRTSLPLNATVERVAAEHGVTMIQMNLETHPMFRDPSLWADSLHLNRSGSRRLTEILIGELSRKRILAPTNEAAITN